MRRLALFIICGSALIGCHKDATVATAPVQPTTPPVTEPPKTDAGDSKTATSNPPPVPKPALPMASLPDILKTDAYDYYGLGNEKPLKLAFRKDNGPVLPATRTVKLIDVKDGKATFEEQQVGGLEDEDQTMSLEADGLYVMSASSGTLKTPHTIELPTRLSVGTVWTDHQEMESAGTDIKLDGKYRVRGFETVKTAAGTFEKALHVSGTTAGSRAGVPVSMTIEDWYARGVGLIKQKLVVLGKLKVTVTTEATK